MIHRKSSLNNAKVNKQDYSIRRLMISDLDAYFSIRLESLKNAPTNFMSSYEEEERTGNTFFEGILRHAGIDNLIFGAFIKDRLVGVIGLYQEKQLKAKHKCNIWGMYVQSDCRQKGIGRALLREAIDHIKDRLKCLIANITVESNNISAIKLYESMGFKLWGNEPKAMCWNGQYFDEYHLSLLLQDIS